MGAQAVSVNSCMYRCRCGCTFAMELGRYGCPNCLGDYGPASISDGSNGQFFCRTVKMTQAQLESMFPPKEESHGRQE